MKEYEKEYEKLEAWLIDNDDKPFTARHLAGELGITWPEASALIQEYLHEQRRKKSRALYHLHREGRTRAAVWHIGHSSADSKATAVEFEADVVAKVRRALMPDLEHLVAHNPRARQTCEAIIEAVTASILPLLSMAAGTFTVPEKDDDK